MDTPNLEQVLAHVESGDVFWFDDHMDVVEKAREEIKRLRALTAWRDIADAPKDGTRILLYTPADEETGWLAFCAESHFDQNGELNTVDAPQWQDGLEPTHWQPLPEPPGQGE